MSKILFRSTYRLTAIGSKYPYWLQTSNIREISRKHSLGVINMFIRQPFSIVDCWQDSSNVFFEGGGLNRQWSIFSFLCFLMRYNNDIFLMFLNFWLFDHMFRGCNFWWFYNEINTNLIIHIIIYKKARPCTVLHHKISLPSDSIGISSDGWSSTSGIWSSKATGIGLWKSLYLFIWHFHFQNFTIIFGQGDTLVMVNFNNPVKTKNTLNN